MLSDTRSHIGLCLARARSHAEPLDTVRGCSRTHIAEREYFVGLPSLGRDRDLCTFIPE